MTPLCLAKPGRTAGFAYNQQREAAAAGIELPQPPEEVDPETEYIETIEEDYGWEYQENQYYWETDALDERPPL